MRKNLSALFTIGLLCILLMTGCSSNDTSTNQTSGRTNSKALSKSANEMMAIGNYVLVSKVQVGRTAFDYTYRASVKNNSTKNAKSVSSTLTSLATSTLVMNGSLTFGDVAAGATVASTNTFTIRIDRTQTFNQNNFKWDIQAVFAEAIGTVDSNGGVIEITDPNSPIKGTKVEIPQDAVPPGESVNISVGYNDELPNPIDSVLVSRVICLSKDSKYNFMQPVIVTIPYNDDQLKTGDIPVVHYWDETYNKYLSMGVENIDSTNKSVTFATVHFSNYLASGAKNYDVEINQTSDDISIDTGFKPDVDGFFIKNFGVKYIEKSKNGNCVGMSCFSTWYYTFMKNSDNNELYDGKQGLYNKYRQGNPFNMDDDILARTITSIAQKDSRNYGLYENNINPNITFSELIYYMKFNSTDSSQPHAPQILIMGLGDGGTHAVVVYNYSGTGKKGKFSIYDSNFPGNINVTLDWDPISGFTNYNLADIYSKYGGIIGWKFMPLSLNQPVIYENIFQNAEISWSKSNKIIIHSPVLDSNNNLLMSDTNNITISGVVTGGIQAAKYLVCQINYVNNPLPIPINNDGTFNFTIEHLPEQTNRICLMSTSDLDDAKHFQYSGASSGFYELFVTKAYTISGNVVLNGSPLDNVTVTLIGLLTGTDTCIFYTGDDGSFAFNNTVNGSYMLTFSKDEDGYTFNPETEYIDVYGSDVALTDIIATYNIPHYSISGKVVSNNNPLSGVTATLTGNGTSSFVTGVDGLFSFNNAANGSYTLTFSKDNYTFNPVSVDVTVTGGNVTFTNGIAAYGILNSNKYVLVNLHNPEWSKNVNWSYSRATGINNNGQIVGYHYEAGVGVAFSFVWDNGNTSNDNSLSATSINDSGYIVGNRGGAGWGYAYLMPNPNILTYVALGSLQGAYPNGTNDWNYIANDINNSGQIIGWSENVDRKKHAVLWENGGIVDLGTFGSLNSEAIAINNSGKIVGRHYDKYYSVSHAFLWDNGIETDLVDLSSAADINDHDQIVGRSGDGQALLWENGAVTYPFEGIGEAFSINNRGQIVGTGNGGALLYENGQVKNIKDMVINISGWSSITITDINDNGQMVGVGIFNNEEKAILLNPVE